MFCRLYSSKIRWWSKTFGHKATSCVMLACCYCNTVYYTIYYTPGGSPSMCHCRILVTTVPVQYGAHHSTKEPVGSVENHQFYRCAADSVVERSPCCQTLFGKYMLYMTGVTKDLCGGGQVSSGDQWAEKSRISTGSLMSWRFRGSSLASSWWLLLLLL